MLQGRWQMKEALLKTQDKQRLSEMSNTTEAVVLEATRARRDSNPQPHVLISDVILPDMNGFCLAAEFEKRYPDCRVLLMSASCDRVQNGRGPRIVSKASITEAAFRLLERCRESGKASLPPAASSTP